MPPVYLLSRIPGKVTRCSDALILVAAFLTPAPFASSSLFQLAHVDFLGLWSTYLDLFAARNLSQQGSDLAQGGLQVEVVEAGDAVFGNYDVEPHHGCA